MQKGHMRFEPNINLQIVDDDGNEYRTPICEVKNLNSFRALERAVAYEQWRQLDEWKRDHSFTLENRGKQNRGWNDTREETVFQREKEEAHDYRYFPEPDLVPVELDDATLARIQDEVCELPLARKQRFMDKFGLSEYDANVLTSEHETADFFDGAVNFGAHPKRVANLITQHGLKIANERNCPVNEIGVTVAQIAQLAKLVDDGTVSASAAATIFEKMLTDDADPQTIAQKNNLLQKSDASELEGLVDEILAAQPQAVAEVRTGSKKAKKARTFLLGQVMQKTQGQANPRTVGELLDKKLQE
jgi:aspartyl-tRNA(Asn)/glutamyl-tRNA(Gln) amidotransferase subunit B